MKATIYVGIKSEDGSILKEARFPLPLNANLNDEKHCEAIAELAKDGLMKGLKSFQERVEAREEKPLK